MNKKVNWFGTPVFVALYLVITVMFFWHFLSLNSADIVSFPGHMSGDTTGYFYPSKVFSVKMFCQGKFPLWNPYIFSGYPHYADPQSQVYYPLNLLLVILGWFGAFNYFTFELFQFLHIFLAALFAYFLAKKIIADRIISFMVGMIYAFSNIMLVHIAAPTLIVSFAYIPLVFLAAIYFLEKTDLLRFVLLALSLVVMGTAGYPGILVATSVFVCAYFIYKAITLKDMRFIMWLVYLYTLVFLLLAAIIMPAHTLANLSVGGNFGYSDPEVNWKFSNYPASFLLTLLIPDNPIWLQGSIYLGIAVFVFFIYTIYLAYKIRIQGVLLYSIGAVLACFMMLGRDNFVYFIFYNLMPGFSLSRFPEMSGLFLVLFIAIIAGLGIRQVDNLKAVEFRRLHRLFVIFMAFYFGTMLVCYILTYFFKMNVLENMANKQAYILIFLGLVYLALVAYGKGLINFTRFKVLLAFLLVLELLTINKPLSASAEHPLEKFKANPLVSKLKQLQSDDLYRLGGSANNLFGVGAGSQFDIDTIFGHATRMNLKDYRLTGLEQKYAMDEYEGKPYYKFLSQEQFYDLLNVRYIIIPQSDLADPRYTLLSSFSDNTKVSEYIRSDVYLYERKTALERFYFVDRWDHVRNLEENAQKLKKAGDIWGYVTVFSQNGSQDAANDQETVSEPTEYILSTDTHDGLVGGEETDNVYTLDLLASGIHKDKQHYLVVKYKNPPNDGLDCQGMIYIGSNQNNLKEFSLYTPNLLVEGLYTNKKEGQMVFVLPSDNLKPGKLFVKFKYRAGQCSLRPMAVSILEKQPLAKREKANNAIIALNSIQSDRAILDVTNQKDGFLVFSEVYYPGWKAKVDGIKSKVSIIDGFLKGVYLNKGKHKVYFYFLPNDWLIGLGLSLLGWVIVILLVILHFTRARKKAVCI